MRLLFIFVTLALAGEARPATPGRTDDVVTRPMGLRSGFRDADIALEFDGEPAAELTFTVAGVGVIREVRCDDAWATAWLSRDEECASPEKGAVAVGASPVYVCVRVEATAFEEGAVGVCRASTSDGAWVMKYTTTSP